MPDRFASPQSKRDRERLALAYIAALENSDFERLQDVLKLAEQDPALWAMIAQVNEAVVLPADFEPPTELSRLRWAQRLRERGLELAEPVVNAMHQAAVLAAITRRPTATAAVVRETSASYAAAEPDYPRLVAALWNQEPPKDAAAALDAAISNQPMTVVVVSHMSPRLAREALGLGHDAPMPVPDESGVAALLIATPEAAALLVCDVVDERRRERLTAQALGHWLLHISNRLPAEAPPAMIAWPFEPEDAPSVLWLQLPETTDPAALRRQAERFADQFFATF